jgi:hypothetical protein
MIKNMGEGYSTESTADAVPKPNDSIVLVADTDTTNYIGKKETVLVYKNQLTESEAKDLYAYYKSGQLNDKSNILGIFSFSEKGESSTFGVYSDKYYVIYPYGGFAVVGAISRSSNNLYLVKPGKYTIIYNPH